MTETEWRTYLRAEIERLLDEASEQKLRLTLALLRAACSRPRTSSGCATSAERLPNSGGAGCRSCTGGSAS